MATVPSFDAKRHWENIYLHKGPTDGSWYRAMPRIPLDMLDAYNVPINVRIINVGCGDSLLVDHLVQRGHTAVTVLDLSGTALRKAQERLGARAMEVTWTEAEPRPFTLRSASMYGISGRPPLPYGR